MKQNKTKQTKQKKSIIALCIVGIIVVYSFGFYLSYAGLLDVTNIATLNDMVMNFPVHYSFLLSFCLAFLLFVLRKQIVDKIARGILSYMIVILSIGCIISVILFLARLGFWIFT